jgi:hypothetical protein
MWTFVSCLYYIKIVNCLVLVVIYFSSSSAAAAVATTAVKWLFCVSTANCCYVGPWRYVCNAFTGNSEVIIERSDFKTGIEMIRGLYNVDTGSAKCVVRSTRYKMNWLSCV